MSAAVYAFVAWISIISSYVVFLVWAFTPEKLLHHYGITYYPNRYYALALPCYFLVTCFFICFLYMGFNMMGTFDPDDKRTVEDDQAIYGPSDFVKLTKQNDYCVPDISDMDICSVTELLLPHHIRQTRKSQQYTQKRQMHSNTNKPI